MTNCSVCKYGSWVYGKEYYCSYPYNQGYVEDVHNCYWYNISSYQDDDDDDEDEDEDDYRDENEDNNDSWCYITTATCNILGMDDDNIYLNTLRDFRNNVMKKDTKYFEMLVLYDIVGPKISKALKISDDKKEISESIMKNIKKACEEINNQNYDEAVKLYYNMTEMLAGYFDIFVPVINNKLVDSIEIEKAGTGKVYQKKISTN